MPQQIYLRIPQGGAISWSRTRVRDLPLGESGSPADEAFLERLVAEKPDLLGIGDLDDESDIEGPFQSFTQLPVRALNGRTIYPDLVLLYQSGQVIVVEVKLCDNPELRDRQVVAQLLEYAAALSQYTEAGLFELFQGPARGAKSWANLVSLLFPDALDTERLAKRFLDKFRTSKLHLVIACDEAPVGLRELVRAVAGQAALGEYKLRVVEVVPFVSETPSTGVIFIPHSVMQTEVVARTAVTVTYLEGNPQPSVDVSVTSLDSIERHVQETREPSARRNWDEGTFFEDAAAKVDPVTADALRRFYDNARQRGWAIRFGTGARDGSYNVIIPAISDRPAIAFFSNGKIWVNFASMSESIASELRNLLRDRVGLNFTEADRYPSVKPEEWALQASGLLSVLDNMASKSSHQET